MIGRLGSAVPLALSLALALGSSAVADPVASVLALQPLAATATATVGDTGLSLTNLNPTVGRWYLLEVTRAGKSQTLNLETPAGVTLGLASDGTIETRHDGQAAPCPLATIEGSVEKSAYSPVCGGGIWIRRSAHGARTVTEAATDILRLGGSAGEALINFYKNNFNSTAEAAEMGKSVAGEAPQALNGPTNAPLVKPFIGVTIVPTSLGLSLDGLVNGRLRIGTWYPVHAVPGVFGTVITADAAGGAFLPDGGSTIDLVAFDLSQFRVNYRVGTDHPALNWSDRAPAPHLGGGPDGFGDTGPLARAGVIPPWERKMLAGVFAGGFKREHGAFKAGPLIGRHYGFAESGVVLSRLVPGMVTVLGDTDGTPTIRTWTDADAAQPPEKLLFARQAGYALIEAGKIAEHVDDPNGNWSGSNEGHLFTMRSGACVAPGTGGRNFLIYGVFTGATPHHMAVTFKAFGCTGAVHLDANSPTLTYAAVFHETKDGLVGEHLHKTMSEADPKGAYKFVDQPDNRDFFYLTRRPN